MCGILGSINLSFQNDLLDLIARRGPDDWGMHEFATAGQQVIFGHRRLSIVDLSPAGHQPISTECGRYHLVFNGEIYNHLDIRNMLRRKSFRGHSDTETILYALAERGIEAVKQFNGIFAFAFLDTVKQQLFLARDPFGVKPLYFFQQGSQLGFSSEMRPLLKMIRPNIEKEALATLLRLRYVPSPGTLFREIRKVIPGHYLCIDLNRPEENKCVCYAAPVPEECSLPFDEQVEQYQTHLAEAVKRQMMADVEVGVLLSGGLDSALVAREAVRCAGHPVKAFTVGFTGKHREDEIQDAAETARLFGMQHYVVRISDKDFFARIAESIAILEEPLATTSVIPMKTLAELASSEVKVVLTGQGADEPLGGYARYQGELLYEKLPFWFAVGAGRLLGNCRFRNSQLQRALKSVAIREDIRRFISESEVFSPDEISRLTGISEHVAEEVYRQRYADLQLSKKKRPVERMMALDARMNLADDLLLYTDKITMHYSLECRVPLLDLPLVRYIESLPGSSRLCWRKGKRIHKCFAEQVLPPEIVHRPKKGFQSPTGEWFQKSKLLQEILLDDNSAFSRYFDIEEVKKNILLHRKGFNRERQIFLLLTTKYWLDQFA